VSWLQLLAHMLAAAGNATSTLLSELTW